MAINPLMDDITADVYSSLIKKGYTTEEVAAYLRPRKFPTEKKRADSANGHLQQDDESESESSDSEDETEKRSGDTNGSIQS